MTVKGSLSILGVVIFAGCAHFHSEPISPENTAAVFDSRSLTNESLRAFLETNNVAVPAPGASWNLKQLTLVAFYYQPVLAEARAQLMAAQAAKITAGQRPNPSVSVVPGYDSQIPGNFSPWLVPLSFDVPIETAGKRDKRIAQSEHLSEAARWNLVGTVWQVRSQIRAALLNLYSTRQSAMLQSQQEMAQSNVVRLLQGQLAAGSVSSFEVTQARTALEATQLAWQDAIGKANQALVDLAHALGLPSHAVADASFSFASLDQFPEELTQPEVRRQALLNRADVRGALAEYAASQSALQFELANQYPDLHLGPGYTWNNGNAGDSMWSLGLSVTLPVLNHNQGPVAEAQAKRMQAATHFMTVQANAVAEIDGALAGYKGGLQLAAAAKALLDDSQKQLDSVRGSLNAGEVDPLAMANAQVDFNNVALSQLDARVKVQQACGQLEDAVQSPLVMPDAVIQSAQKSPESIKPHSKHDP